MHRAGLLVAASLIITALASACSAPPDASGAALAGEFDAGAASTASTGDNGGDDTNCTGDDGTSTPATPPDISTLPSCCTDGAAHCVPTGELPPGQDVSQLASCSGGACVPDTFIKSNGAAPPHCASLNGADGVCLSVCVPQVSQYKDLLPQASCAADERCAPCISPLNNQSTGACDIGKKKGGGSGGTCAPKGTGNNGPSGSSSDAGAPAPMSCPYSGPPVIDPSTLPSCDPNGGAHCLSASLVPSTMASQLATCPTGLCVPDVFIAAGGNYIPKTCASTFGAEGRCLDEMIPQVASQIAQLPQDSCQSFERCVPCFNPLDGSKTGACNLSCDPGPSKPAVTLQQCCDRNNTEEGLCIPTTSIPASEQSNLSQDKCTDPTTLCVPKEMTSSTFKPPACTGQGLLGIFTGSYTGVCLSKCLHFSFIQKLGIGQGTCDGDHDCAPCTNPLDGTPTGAPGCP